MAESGDRPEMHNGIVRLAPAHCHGGGLPTPHDLENGSVQDVFRIGSRQSRALCKGESRLGTTSKQGLVDSWRSVPYQRLMRLLHYEFPQ